MRLTQGKVYDVSALQFAGWTTGDGTGADGYRAGDYFDSRGVYLGPDEHGIEPVFSDWGTIGKGGTMTLRDDVLAVMRDGSRTDRYLVLDDGGLRLTTEDISARQYPVIPSLDASEEDEEASVDAVIEAALERLAPDA